MVTRSAKVFALPLLLVVLAGCSGSDSGEADASKNNGGGSATLSKPVEDKLAVPTGDGAVATVKSWLKAVEEGDGVTACDMVSDEYAKDWVEEAVEWEMVEPDGTCVEVAVISGQLIEAFGGFENTVELVSHDGDDAVVKVAYESDEQDGGVYTLGFDEGRWSILDDE